MSVRVRPPAPITKEKVMKGFPTRFGSLKFTRSKKSKVGNQSQRLRKRQNYSRWFHIDYEDVDFSMKGLFEFTYSDK